jgi:hypothetical protein
METLSQQQKKEMNSSGALEEAMQPVLLIMHFHIGKLKKGNKRVVPLAVVTQRMILWRILEELGSSTQAKGLVACPLKRKAPLGLDITKNRAESGIPSYVQPT